MAKRTCTPTRPTDRPTDRHPNTLFALRMHEMMSMFNAYDDDDYRDAARSARAKSSALMLQNGGAAVSVS